MTTKLKCLTCLHAPVCATCLGGADLDIVSLDCPHYLPNMLVPTRFYLICDVPGFYDIVEYQVERILYEHGSLSRMWGANKNSVVVAYVHDLGTTVFWSSEEAQARIDYLIEERRNGNDGMS